MEAMNQFLVISTGLLGFVVGLALSTMAKDELKPGQKWFELLRRILFFAVFTPILYVSLEAGNFGVSIPLAGILLFFSLVKVKWQEIGIYVSFFVILWISLSVDWLLVLESSLIFLYGLPSGTLIGKDLS